MTSTDDFTFSFFSTIFSCRLRLAWPKQNADQVERLNESGELRQMLKIYKVSEIHNQRMLIYLAEKRGIKYIHSYIMKFE